MASIRVLHDGWPLIHQPNHPRSIHLRTLLALAPEGTESILALPTESFQIGEAPDKTAEILTIQEGDPGRWQQKQLARLAEEHDAQIIHSTSSSASLFGRVSTVISPAGFTGQDGERKGWRHRFGQSLGRGGLARAHILWPSDLPQSQLPGRLHPLSPAVHPAFNQKSVEEAANLDLPESYVLYHGPGDPESILKLLESWTWAASSIGEYFPLLIAGLSYEAKQFVEARLPEFHVEDYVQLVPALAFDDLIALYQHCSALAHPAISSAWGGPIRHALASGKAVVAFNDPQTEALVGSAAFLVPKNDLRAFGAALISVVVDEKVAQSLEDAARHRTASWDMDKFKEELLTIYRKIA